MSSHPADETLAAFADGRLDRRGADELLEHLADCDDCRSIFDAIADAQDEGVIERPGTVVRGNFGRGAAITTLAAAAAVTAVFFTPPVQERVRAYRSGGVTELVEAVESLDRRPIEARVAGGFPHREFTAYRGAETEPEAIDMDELPLAEAALKIMARAGEEPSRRELRAVGLSQLFQGMRDEAIVTLKKASDAAGGDDPVLLNDLAAAYLERARFGDEGDQYAKLARETAEKAWSLSRTPEIAWNRALAHRGTEQENAAWQDYLKLDPSSPWAREVREEHLDSGL